ncbi:MAG: hypothetical protein PUE07_00490 [bacterium]|nr:hypothetical protein [bacterium]
MSVVGESKQTRDVMSTISVSATVGRKWSSRVRKSQSIPIPADAPRSRKSVKASVYKWESGLSTIRESNLKSICDTYNISEDWMKGYDMPKVPETDDHVKSRQLINHAMMFLTEKDLLKAELFISDILEQPLHIGIMKPSDTEALA